MPETSGKVGKSVTCTTCGQRKKPIGRSAPLDSYLCDDDCPGYREEPRAGNLWPGESEADFGYCDTCGWPFRDGACTNEVSHA